MLLKRKRSSSEFSSSTASSSASPPQKNTFDFNFTMGDAFASRSSMISPSPSHLNSRTMKRLRNGRPSDEEVHQRTLDILYSAQRQLIESDLPLASTEEETPMEQQLADTDLGMAQQSSLHRFWNIKSAPPRPLPHGTTTNSIIEGTSPGAGLCAHGRPIAASPNDEDMMDVDGVSTAGAACEICGR